MRVEGSKDLPRGPLETLPIGFQEDPAVSLKFKVQHRYKLAMDFITRAGDSAGINFSQNGPLTMTLYFTKPFRGS